MSNIYAVHFMNADLTSREGREKPWKVGETRTVKGALELCRNGYHYAPTWKGAIAGSYLYGPMACIVEVDDDGPKDEHKGVSRTRTLVEAHNVEKAMRLFAADEAERALKAWEKRTGEKADRRSWAAVAAARGHAAGAVTDVELAAAQAAAWAAAQAAARDAAQAAARDAAQAAAHAAAWAAAWAAARDAAWAAAQAAAGAAARDAAQAAARAAAWAAAWAAARDAAWAAAQAAAWAAAGAAAWDAAWAAAGDRFAAAMNAATGTRRVS